MKLTLNRQGGFANIPLNIEADTAAVEPAVADHLAALINKVMPFVDPPADANVADVCSYTLTVNNDGQESVLHTNDMHLTDQLQDLIEYLTQTFNQ